MNRERDELYSHSLIHLIKVLVVCKRVCVHLIGCTVIKSPPNNIITTFERRTEVKVFEAHLVSICGYRSILTPGVSSCVTL